MDLQDRCHFVVTSAFGFGINIEIDSADHFLHIRAPNYFIGKLPQTSLAIEQQNSETEFHAKFRFQSSFWLVVEESCSHVVVCTGIDLLYLRGLEFVGFDEAGQLRHRWMC